MKKLVLILALLVALAPVASSQNGWVSQNGNMGFIARSANSASAVTITQQNASACSLALKSGSTTVFSVCGTATTFAGIVKFADGTAAAPSLAFASAPTTGWFNGGSGVWSLSNGAGSATINLDGVNGDINASASIRAKSNTAYISLGGSSDVKLNWDAANTLALRNGTTGQKFNIYQSYTDASNYERLQIQLSSNLAQILTASSGTGAALGMRIGTVDSGTLSLYQANAARWVVASGGHFITGADNTYDIGASGATRPRNIYAGTTISASTNFVTSSGGSYNWSGSSYIYAPANGKIAIVNAASTSGVTLDAATDSTLKVFARDGSSAATVQASILKTTSTVNLNDTSYISSPASDQMQLANHNGNQGVVILLSTNGTADFRAIGAGDTAIVKSNGAQFTGLASVSGVNYVCSSTTGVLSKNNTACVGTDAEAIASIPSLRAEIADLRAQLATIVRRQ